MPQATPMNGDVHGVSDTPPSPQEHWSHCCHTLGSVSVQHEILLTVCPICAFEDSDNEISEAPFLCSHLTTAPSPSFPSVG